MTITDHAFKPYTDHPDLCAAELYSCDTCNRQRAEHGPAPLNERDISERASAVKRLRRHLEATDWEAIPNDVLDLRRPDTHIRVGRWEDGYSVYWEDYVANDWAQWFSTLSDAFAFCAALAYCEQHDWRLFIDKPEQFTAAGFLHTITH